MVEPAHTPLPWTLGWENTVCTGKSEWDSIPLASGFVEDAWTKDDATDESRANAAFIVRACNSHYELIEAIEWVCAILDGLPISGLEAQNRVNKARGVIAKARGHD